MRRFPLFLLRSLSGCGPGRQRSVQGLGASLQGISLLMEKAITLRLTLVRVALDATT